jgi:hypothetical protein
MYRAAVTIAIQDIIRECWRDKDPTMPYFLQMASWETLPILKEALVYLTLGRPTLTT